MVTDSVPLPDRKRTLREGGLDVDRDLRNLRIVHKPGNTSVRRSLDALPLHEYNSCMILADQQYENNMMHSDSHVLATLLLLRNLQNERQTIKRKETERHDRKSAAQERKQHKQYVPPPAQNGLRPPLMSLMAGSSPGTKQLGAESMSFNVGTLTGVNMSSVMPAQPAVDTVMPLNLKVCSVGIVGSCVLSLS